VLLLNNDAVADAGVPDALERAAAARPDAGMLACKIYLENDVLRTLGIEGLVLRYGGLYGPGTGLTDDADLTALLHKRRFPIIGDGAGVWSFVHVDDAAAATVAAIDAGGPGSYNVADDEPAAVADWLPELARALDAPPPRHVPVWLGRLVAGTVAVSMMTRIRGADNAKAKRELGWVLRYPSWREGFRLGLSESSDHRVGAARA